MNIVKWVVGIIVVVLIIWGISASVSKKGPAKEAETGPVKIGVILPLTGDAAAYGEPARNVMQMATDEINSSGGINGPKIELVTEDGKCSGKDAASAASKLINVDKVQVIIGGFCSSESLAAEPIATQNKVLLFSAGSSSPDLTGKSKYFVRNYPSDATQGKVLAEVAYSKKSWKKVAFIQEQLDYPLGIYKTFSANFEKFGGQIVKEEFATSVTDFRSSLAKLKSEKPDALFIDTQTAAAAERIFKQVQELKWSVPLLISDGVAGDQETITRNAAFLEGALAAEFGIDPDNAKFRLLLANYKNKFDKELPYQSYAQTEYDAVYMIRDGIAAVGHDGGKLAKWVRFVKDWTGASGQVLIGEDGDRVGGHVPKVIKNGKVELYSK